MLQPILSFLGLAPRTPALPAGVKVVSMDADGPGAFAFAPGKKPPPRTLDLSDTPEARRLRMTMGAMVWPGKIETMRVQNDEGLPQRFDLVITMLNPALFSRRPPQGGKAHKEGGVWLEPGEEAVFTVEFIPPRSTMEMRPQTFHLRVNRYDPDNPNDAGETVEDRAPRWVPQPTEQDVRLTAHPTELTLRPWRRAAIFALEIDNRSELPPQVNLEVTRGAQEETPDGANSESETLGSLTRVLEPRTGCLWLCLLPPTSRFQSYEASAEGTARMTESLAFPLTLANPVRVRFVPWLRLGKDWLALGAGMVALLWLVWGIPVYKRPVARVAVQFAGLPPGQFPEGGRPEDLKLVAIPYRGSHAGEAIPGAHEQGAVWRFDLPGRWTGYRWPFGWNKAGQEPLRFQIQASVQGDNKPSYSDYDTHLLRAAKGDEFFVASLKDISPVGEWSVTRQATAQRIEGIRLDVYLADLGALKSRAAHLDKIQIMATYNGGTPIALPAAFPKDASETPVAADLDLHAPRKKGYVEVWAVADNVSSLRWGREVEPQNELIPVYLTFPPVLSVQTELTGIEGRSVQIVAAAVNDTRIPVFVNDRQTTFTPVPGGLLVALPPGIVGKAKIEAQPFGRPRMLIAQIDIRPAPNASQSPADVAYDALLYKDNDRAIQQALLIGKDEQAFSLAIQGYAQLRSGANETNETAKSIAVEEAQKLFQRAERAPDDSRDKRGHALALCGLGLVEDVYGDKVQAEKNYNAAIKTDPRLALTIANYADFLYRDKRISDGKALLQAAIRQGYLRHEDFTKPVIGVVMNTYGIPQPP